MNKTIILLVMLALFTVSGCAPAGVIVVHLKGDAEIEIARNQELEVELEANPTTGYSWRVSGLADSSILRLKGGSHYERKSDLIGGGDIEKYRFEALRGGRADLVFEYQRPWEDKEPVKKYTLGVVVR
ncbi:MAG: protease inhibitor I42 family protein [Candidatus Omnitrophota bacterium]